MTTNTSTTRKVRAMPTDKRKSIRRTEDISLNHMEAKMKELEKESVKSLVRLEHLEKMLFKIDHRTEEMEKSFQTTSANIIEILDIYTKSKGAIWFLRLSVIIGTPLFLAWVWLKSHLTFTP